MMYDNICQDGIDFSTRDLVPPDTRGMIKIRIPGTAGHKCFLRHGIHQLEYTIKSEFKKNKAGGWVKAGGAEYVVLNGVLLPSRKIAFNRMINHSSETWFKYEDLGDAITLANIDPVAEGTTEPVKVYNITVEPESERILEPLPMLTDAESAARRDSYFVEREDEIRMDILETEKLIELFSTNPTMKWTTMRDRVMYSVSMSNAYRKILLGQIRMI